MWSSATATSSIITAADTKRSAQPQDRGISQLGYRDAAEEPRIGSGEGLNDPGLHTSASQVPPRGIEECDMSSDSTYNGGMADRYRGHRPCKSVDFAIKIAVGRVFSTSEK